MAAVALIKFTQGATVGNDGEALIVNGGATVTIENSSNTDVVAWTIDLVEAPPGSILHTDPGTWTNLGAASDNTPVANFLPDAAVPGTYRIRLEVEDALGVTNVDIRNVCVLTDNRSIVLSPYMELPQPLPLTDPSSPQPDQKPDELNFGGQKLGWCGGAGGTPVFMNDALLDFDKMPPVTGLSANDTVRWDGSKWVSTSAIQTDDATVTLQPATGDITHKVATGQAHVFQVNSVEVSRFDVSSDDPRLLFPFISGQDARIKLANRTTDGAGQTLYIEGQDAQGTNQDGGNVVVNLGAPTGSGAHGSMVWSSDGTDFLSVQLTSSDVVLKGVGPFFSTGLKIVAPDTSFIIGTALTLQGGPATGMAGDAGEARLFGGDAGTDANGGNAIVAGADSGTSSGDPGDAFLEGGSAARTNCPGGHAYVRAGGGDGTEAGGDVYIVSGLGGATGDAGNVYVNLRGAIGAGADGKIFLQHEGDTILEVQLGPYQALFQGLFDLDLIAGTPALADYDGATVTVKGGTGSETTGYGGRAWLLGGDAATEGSRGGSAVVEGGVSGSVSGDGGNAYVEGGSVHSSRTNGNGGDVYIRGAFAKGTGEGGSVFFQSGLSPSGKPGSIDLYVYKSNGGSNYGTINFRTGSTNPPNNLCMVLGDSARDTWYSASDGWYLAYDSTLGEAEWRVLPVPSTAPLTIPAISNPGTPSSGNYYIWVDTSDNKLKATADTGNVTELALPS